MIYLDDFMLPEAQLFGVRLRERRKAMKLTQGQLGERVDMAAASISVIERGRANPTIAVMAKLAKAVGSEAWAMLRPSPASGDD
ncbi:helix-turn-helix domain-containing protein [Sphingomonas sp. BK481]|uniref:helix-turn-helix domain-containing protein n=1 Tax=Sphingomonas sp. BK481 TaxID=2586981 RepID=UPI00161F4C10|nr:helix-turn-helix transcriptional regulator [Sphingomonas sp. BK481]MBB3589001.1 hypothetical protein [Sphingomonas sp. BK481]